MICFQYNKESIFLIESYLFSLKNMFLGTQLIIYDNITLYIFKIKFNI